MTDSRLRAELEDSILRSPALQSGVGPAILALRSSMSPLGRLFVGVSDGGPTEVRTEPFAPTWIDLDMAVDDLLAGVGIDPSRVRLRAEGRADRRLSPFDEAPEDGTARHIPARADLDVNLQVLRSPIGRFPCRALFRAGVLTQVQPESVPPHRHGADDQRIPAIEVHVEWRSWLRWRAGACNLLDVLVGLGGGAGPQTLLLLQGLASRFPVRDDAADLIKLVNDLRPIEQEMRL